MRPTLVGAILPLTLPLLGAAQLRVVASGRREALAANEMPQAPRNDTRHRLALLPAGA